VAQQSGDHVFTFSVPLTEGENHIRVVAGDLEDEAVFIRKANPKSYKLEKKRSKSANWV
jgi:hypothetical protein